MDIAISATKIRNIKQYLRAVLFNAPSTIGNYYTSLVAHDMASGALAPQEPHIKAFESTAKKYGIDFALKKDATETPPRYLVFFKGRDADALTAAFKEFSAKKLTQDKKPSIRKALAAFREKAKELNASRQQTKHKDREVSL